jgi:integrase
MTRGECIKLIDMVVVKHGTSQGAETRRHLSGLLSWAVNRDYLPNNPLSGARLPALVQKLRERVLDTVELKAVWSAAEAIEFPYGPYVQMLLLTACRRTEMAQLRSEWIKDANGVEVIEIPAEYTKTKVVHVVPITSAIRYILDKIPIGVRGPYLFSTTRGERPISGFAKILTAYHTESNTTDWVFHDLRRTVATELAGSRVPQE